MIKPSAAMEQVRYWRRPELGRVELLQARYRRQNFGPHFHRCYAFGVIEAGAMAFNYLGRKFVASAGKVNLVCPGETHDGSAAGPDGWRYRMIYLGPDIVIRAAEEAFGRAATRPLFQHRGGRRPGSRPVRRPPPPGHDRTGRLPAGAGIVAPGVSDRFHLPPRRDQTPTLGRGRRAKSRGPGPGVHRRPPGPERQPGPAQRSGWVKPVSPYPGLPPPGRASPPTPT